MPINEEPIQKDFVRVMNNLARVLQHALNDDLPVSQSKVGFCLLVFHTAVSEDNRTNYICNCNREDMLASMKEFIARAEGNITDKENLQ